MKILYISPTYFDRSSVIGGGERYAMELAARMAENAEVVLMSFSAHRESYKIGKLKVELYPVRFFFKGNRVNPLSFRCLRQIFTADVVHIFQINTFMSDLICLIGFLSAKAVFATDHGGGADFVLNRRLPVYSCYRKIITLSDFGKMILPDGLKKKAVVIKGGIDIHKFSSRQDTKKEKKILFVGRILPHKGIHDLIGAMRILGNSDYKLHIVGMIYDKEYYQRLQDMAVGLPVSFIQDVSDSGLVEEYSSAMVTVLASTHNNPYTGYTPVPELMGLTLLESQACRVPVVCTDAGGMKEFVSDGKTGIVVGQNSPEQIAQAIKTIITLPVQSMANGAIGVGSWLSSLFGKR